ncbi:MAG: TIGR00730 family Rossman fold protein [Anaerolineae bacterium]|nr:TIGR00730 family Rossman fold protein [Anaerolineae bacterium]MDW8173974.1 TIGR00730 family Rossman fold protein [Anaerolineae bacterium]
MTRTIAVYGSARLLPDDPVYQQTYAVGRALAQTGYVVMTGGYGGVMAAASQGAAEAGGHVIGVTVGQRLTAEKEVNPWVKEEIYYDKLDDRLAHLVERADGYVVMPGGIGTLQEITEAWTALRIHIVPPRPFVFYGYFWRPIFDLLAQSPYISPTDSAMIHFVQDIDAMLDYLAQWYAQEKA